MRTFFALSFLAASALTAGAQQPDFQWSKSEAAGTAVSVHNINGDVTILPGSGSTVSVTAHRTDGAGDDIYAVVREYADQVVVCVLWRDTDESCDQDGAHMHSRNRQWRDRGQMDVTVHVPATMTASVGTVSGDIRIQGAHGAVRATTVSGDLRLSDLDATSVEATSVSGDVHVAIAAMSGSGGISARSVSGDLDVRVGALAGTGDLTFRSVSGDVTITLPASLNADFAMSTVSGELDTDFPLTLNGHVGRRSIDARIGTGGRQFKVSTVSGDVSLRAVK
ncbi:MAG TPA: DUF4097 family beta strand repeat-containing protein [Gemmatimonadaceae bacterium]|nr:DUF4097 family beta strand repeat-containing protein [Gemmatimonadaceae bacterium]